MPADLEAYVLIGGNSRRFGSDKAFVEFEGQSLAERAVGTIEIAFPGIQVTFVAAFEGQFGIKSESLARPVIFDRRTGLGAWSGVEAALSSARKEWTLVLACDLPFVTAEFLIELSDAATDGIDAVVPRQPDGRLQPLCALYRTSAVGQKVDQLMTSATLPPLASIFDEIRTTIIDAGPEVLRNVNTPGDLA